MALGEDTKVYGLVGPPCHESQTATYYDTIWEIIAEAFKLSNEEGSLIPPDKSLRDFFVERLPHHALSIEEQAQILQMAETWGSFIGDDWEVQSLKWFWLEECLEGGQSILSPRFLYTSDRREENLFVVGSHIAMFQRLSQAVHKAARIRLNALVTRVENTEQPDSDPSIRVTVNHCGEIRSG